MQSKIIALQATKATGPGGAVKLDPSAFAGFQMQVSGTFVADYNIEGSLDGINYTPQQLFDQATGFFVTSFSAPARFFSITGSVPPYLRLNCQSWSSGTAVVVVARIDSRGE